MDQSRIDLQKVATRIGTGLLLNLCSRDLVITVSSVCYQHLDVNSLLQPLEGALSNDDLAAIA